ncbi:hypothetical protein K488DRAFT_74681 [Vararia minispora EC-137]|uniref:Uncharacterized protein n=1 Tax=Vararia minispora EC-137 TaxID=1314806 RepID=A0ACB8Q789_9AGAM|nr:hypothetical protein K488DRAFT_74681 [Vararia minispora EC-137]
MGKFNPMMLDASVRDVVSALSSEEKTDVLLYAMDRIVSSPAARTTIENAASTVIQMSSAHPAKAIQARLLRAKARLAAGMRGAANKDLQEILELDPHHPEASTLMPSKYGWDRPLNQLRYMNEIWSQVASYLPKRDLRTVLQVPHPLSAVASGLLLQSVSLHFGSQGDSKELDDWHARRSAEILNHLSTNPPRAACVRSLHIFASGGREAYAFQLAMVENVLPKLVNLSAFGCHMNGDAMYNLLLVLEKNSAKSTGAKLSSLVLDPTTPLPGALPKFPDLTHFAYGGENVDVSPTGFDYVLRGRSVALRSLVVHNSRFPLDGRVPLSNLTSLDLRPLIRDRDLLQTIFAEGRHLEMLSLSCKVSRNDSAALSEAFRDHAGALPSLRGFALLIDGSPRDASDADPFVPAVTKFVCAHPDLRSLRITNTLAGQGQVQSGVIWSALKHLHQLEVLSLDLPKDPVLASYLVPPSVVSLNLRFVHSEGASLVAQLLFGLPRGLRMLSIPPISMSATLRDMLHTTLPKLSMLALGAANHSVTHTEAGIELARWSERRSRYYLCDELDGLGEGAESAPWATGLPWHW